MAWYSHPTTQVIDSNGGTGAITQLNTAWALWEADANVHWTRASSSLVAPAYLVLKRKDGSAGRIIFTGGTAPASNYVGYSETGVAATLYMGYDPIATSDTPGNYSVNGGALFGSPSDLGRLRGASTQRGSYNVRLYCNDTADIVFMHFRNPGVNTYHGNIFAWGKLIKLDSGATPESYMVMGKNTTNDAWKPSPSVTSSVGTTSNLASSTFIFYRDTQANEGTTSAWNLLMDTNGGTFVYHQGTNAYSEQLYSKPNGQYKFAPFVGVPSISGSFARPSFVLAYSRHWGFGHSITADYVWIDNSLATRGYFLGACTNAANDISALSLLNDTF